MSGHRSAIPVVTAAEMREVDRLMVEEYGVWLMQMMENAGRNLAELARRQLGGSVLGKDLIVAAGQGNNGGGGLVAARHLANWGAGVAVLLEGAGLSGVPALQWEILKRLPLEKRLAQDALSALTDYKGDLIIDALIGYGLAGPPRGWTACLIEAINDQNRPVIALDVPSGLDATTGEIYHPCIRATATLTLALPKAGLMKPGAREAVGALYLADIGVPETLYEKLGLAVGRLFARDAIIPVDV